MRCPYCQQNIRVQGRFCPKCGEQIFGLPVRQQTPPTGTPPGATPPAAAPAPPPPAPPPELGRPAPPPVYRPFGGSGANPDYDDSITIETDETPAARGVPAGSPAAPSGVHPAAGDEVGKTCPYCRFPLKPGEQVMTCPACKVPHHADCWSENRGCTTYGCQGTAAPAPPPPGMPSLQRPGSVLSPPATVGMPDFGMLQQTEFLGRANTALTVAIIGVMCCGLPSLIGFFMGIGVLTDLGRARANVPAARSKAIAAIVVGSLSVLGWFIWMVVNAAGQRG